MKHRLAAMAVATIALSALVGCGSDEGGADPYCDQLSSLQSEVVAAGDDRLTADAAVVALFFERSEALANQAPAEIADDWKVVTTVVEILQEKIEPLGLSIREFYEITSTGEVPAGISEDDLGEVFIEMQSALSQAGLDDTQTDSAFEAIDTHAKDSCGIDLDDTLADGDDEVDPEGAGEPE